MGNVLRPYEGQSPYETIDGMAEVIIDNNCQLPLIEIPSTEQFTYSFWVKGSMNIKVCLDSTILKSITATEDWEKYVVTFNAIKEQELFLQLGVGTAYLYNTKLERGNIPTDYTEAPEEVTEEVAKLSLTVDGFNTSVKKVYGDGATFESAIQQTHNQLAFLVNGNGITSEIKLTQEFIELASKNIRLKADKIVVDSPNLKIDENGNIDANNGKFKGDITGSSGEFTKGFKVNVPLGNDLRFGIDFGKDSSGKPHGIIGILNDIDTSESAYIEFFSTGRGLKIRIVGEYEDYE